MTTTEATPEAPTLERAVVPRLGELFPGPGHWTERDYLALPETNRFVELADGSLEIHEMPSEVHQRVLGNLYFLLRLFLQDHPLGTLRPAPLPVRLRPGLIREPDLVFLSTAHTDRIAEQFWGVPDLVVEVHSPSTRALDQGDKMREYALAGIAEYWMVDTDDPSIAVYVMRDRPGAYVLHGRFGATDTLTSPQLPTLALDLAAVFAVG